MKLIPFIILLTAGVAGLYFTQPNNAAVNPVLGDTSYEVMFGENVPSDLDEKTRIRIHLAYVEQLLRKKDTQHLSPELREKRMQAISLLHSYWQGGQFPSNYDYPNERKPCFRDKNNQICAVGFLIQQTGHEALVQEIEASENYATIYEMTNPKLLKWVAQSGLTLEECAMIQPTYYTPVNSNANYIPPAYAISSSAISGVGLSTSLINLSQLKTSSKHGWIMPSIGIASGISQTLLGSFNYNRNVAYQGWLEMYPEIPKRHQNLSMFNIAFGTFTTVFNTYALVYQLRNKKKRKDISLNLYGFQTPTNEVNIGFRLTKQF
ncbi:MAG: hypothetical protein HWE22_10680 [Flavobacteriales bacterium]|nr:hypothetical protein [Flavobacteriales bacterium]